MPAALTSRISSAVGEVMKQPDVTTRLNGMSMVSTGSSSAEFAKFITTEAKRWGNVIRISGAKAQ
jgi:tripartite-type tricarboxylate transporter receptor subunit TctC